MNLSSRLFMFFVVFYLIIVYSLIFILIHSHSLSFYHLSSNNYLFTLFSSFPFVIIFFYHFIPPLSPFFWSFPSPFKHKFAFIAFALFFLSHLSLFIKAYLLICIFFIATLLLLPPRPHHDYHSFCGCSFVVLPFDYFYLFMTTSCISSSIHFYVFLLIKLLIKIKDASQWNGMNYTVNGDDRQHFPRPPHARSAYFFH